LFFVIAVLFFLNIILVGWFLVFRFLKFILALGLLSIRFLTFMGSLDLFLFFRRFLDGLDNLCFF